MEPIVGHSMGYEFFESISIKEDSEGVFKPGMIFNVMLVLQNVEGKVGRKELADCVCVCACVCCVCIMLTFLEKGAMALGDTVQVTDAGVDILTKAAKDGLQYDLEDKVELNEAKAEKPEDGRAKTRVLFFLPDLLLLQLKWKESASLECVTRLP